MQRSKTAILSALMVTAALSAAPVLAAQNAPAGQAQSQAPMAPAAAQPTDQQLQRFASASQKVSGVVNEYRPKVDAAKTDADKQKVIQEADAKMVKLVRADGLSVEEFNGIGQAVEQNPGLAQRARDMAK
ncbi:MAG: DUF4168 domain-containing protein [Achromobacter sp.]|nr:DUF4168 domain-containing protein [Achromobacter sp.]